MTDVENIEVTMLGRSYTLACEKNEKPSLLAAVALVDSKMNSLKTARKNSSSDRIAVMTALQLAHELLTLQARPAPEAPMLMPADENFVDIAEIRHRIQGMNQQIETVLAPQEKLF